MIRFSSLYGRKALLHSNSVGADALYLPGTCQKNRHQQQRCNNNNNVNPFGILAQHDRRTNHKKKMHSKKFFYLSLDNAVTNHYIYVVLNNMLPIPIHHFVSGRSVEEICTGSEKTTEPYNCYVP